jgi:drug/metabolite transporter superfamily protein YnfA
MSARVELADLLAGFAAAREAASQPEGATRVPALTAAVHRRRVMRATVTTAAAAAVVLGVGAGVYGLTSPEPTPPAETLTPTPTPDETEEPEVTPEPELLGSVTVHPLLPEAEPLPAGLVEETTPGWSMVTYYPVDRDSGDHPTVLYLLAPDGRLFEVPTPVPLMAPCDFCDGGADDTAPALKAWLPGTSLAIVSPLYDDVELDGHYQVVDLLSGAVLQSIDAPGGSWVTVDFVRDGTTDVLVVTEAVAIEPELAEVTRIERRRVDGTVVAEHGGVDVVLPLSWRLSPDGALLALPGEDGAAVVLRASDLTEVARPVPGAARCPAGDGGHPLMATGWVDDQTLLFTCTAFQAPSGDPLVGPQTAVTTAVAVPLAGEPRMLAPEVVGSVEGVAGGRLLLHDWLAGTWTALGPDGARTDLDLRTSWLPPNARLTRDRLVHVEDQEWNGGPTWTVVSTDLATGETRALLPLVDSASRVRLVVGW